jgi:hypothetical protein
MEAEVLHPHAIAVRRPLATQVVATYQSGRRESLLSCHEGRCGARELWFLIKTRASSAGVAPELS